MGPFTLQPRLGLCSAQLGLGAGWCIYICYLDQTWIRSSMSLLLQTCHLSAKKCYTSRLKLQSSKQQMMDMWCRWNWAVLSPTPELCRVWIASILGQPSVNTLSHAQLELSLSSAGIVCQSHCVSLALFPSPKPWTGTGTQLAWYTLCPWVSCVTLP